MSRILQYREERATYLQVQRKSRVTHAIHPHALAHIALQQKKYQYYIESITRRYSILYCSKIYRQQKKYSIHPKYKSIHPSINQNLLPLFLFFQFTNSRFIFLAHLVLSNSRFLQQKIVSGAIFHNCNKSVLHAFQ